MTEGEGSDVCKIPMFLYTQSKQESAKSMINLF